MKNEKSIENVKSFWESNPLWTGETTLEPGSKEFFDEHRNVVIGDCMASSFDKRFLPSKINKDAKILDLGCGIGFWTAEFGLLGYTDVTSADLTENALKLTKKRCEIYQLAFNGSQQNAENMTFEDSTFDHVNCQGVIHHTPNTEKTIQEIARVLKPNGTASISVYYKNIFLRSWPIIAPFGKAFGLLGAKLKGRGRENIYKKSDVNEIVRLYDGDENPIGKAYTRKEFEYLVKDYFILEEMYLHFFPARSLPFRIPRALHKFLDKNFGFMVYASLRKR